jgi:hypothetical protein
MFFYFNYQKLTNNSSYTGFASMPTDQMKGANGVFDETQLEPLDGSGNKIPLKDSNNNNIINPCTGAIVYTGQLFDPATQTTVGGNMCRFPYATDNVIPAGAIDPVAKKLLQYFQEPNQNVSQGINNDYYYLVETPSPAFSTFGRIDYDFNAKNRLTSSIRQADNNAPLLSEWNCPVACGNDDTTDYSSQTSDVWSIQLDVCERSSVQLQSPWQFSYSRLFGLELPIDYRPAIRKSQSVPQYQYLRQ